MLVFFALVGCNVENIEKRPINDASLNFTDVNGYWSADVGSGRSILLCIDSSNTCFFSPAEQLCEYSRNESDIKIVAENNFVYRFKILALDNSKISLKVSDTKTKSLLTDFIGIGKKYNVSIDTLHFDRLIQQNELVINEVLFRASPEQGDVESFYLKIDSNRRLTYFGESGFERLSGYSTDLNDSTFSELQKRVRLIDVNGLEESYSRNRTGQQSWDLIVKFRNSDDVNVSVYSQSSEPPELRVLINYFHDLVRTLDMRRDKSITPLSFEELGLPYSFVLEQY